MVTAPAKHLKPSLKARNSAARLAAVQAVYQQAESGQKAADVIAEYESCRLGKPVDGEAMVPPDGRLFRAIVGGVEKRRDDLSGMIDSFLRARGTGIGMMDPLLRAILLCGGYELLAHHDTDPPVIITDYMNVTSAFYAQNETKLINAILDRVKGAVRDSDS